MNLLASKCYDPAVAVTKATTALLAMTALDTVNLRNAFVVPPSGIVRVHMSCVLHGATTAPQILLGILEGATVKCRVAPMFGTTNPAATSFYKCEADFCVSGLTPGASLNWDAAYGVETLVAATGIKYGGPNDTTANNAFGGFVFEIWDPCSIYTPASGTAPTSTVHVKLDTIDDFVDTEVAAILAAVDTEIGAIKTTTDKFTFTTANKVDATIQAAADFAQGAADKVWATAARALTDKAGFALSAAGVSAIWDQLLTAITTVGSIGKLIKDNLDAVLSTIKSKTDNLPADPADASDVMGALAVINADTDDIQAKLVARLDVAVSTRSSHTANDAADAILGRHIAGGSSAGRLVKDCFRFIRNRKAIAAGTLTVYQEDDSTSAWTAAVTTAVGNPISEVDPA